MAEYEVNLKALESKYQITDVQRAELTKVVQMPNRWRLEAMEVLQSIIQVFIDSGCETVRADQVLQAAKTLNLQNVFKGKNSTGTDQALRNVIGELMGKAGLNLRQRHSCHRRSFFIGKEQ